jgi:hypothetical protein
VEEVAYNPVRSLCWQVGEHHLLSIHVLDVPFCPAQLTAAHRLCGSGLGGESRGVGVGVWEIERARDERHGWVGGGGGGLLRDCGKVAKGGK